MKPLADTQQLVKRLQQIPLNRVQPVLNLILVLLLAWLFARLSWQLIPAPTAAPLPPAGVDSTTVTKRGGVNLTSLLNFSLFGKAAVQTTAEPVAVVAEAPKTQLNVKLTGLVAMTTAPGQGSAIIESRGAEATYAVDDTIAGTNAVLKQVLIDRVLLQQAGRYETLMLDGIEYTKIAQANAGLGRADEQGAEETMDMAPEPEPMEMAPMQANEALELRREELIAEPMKFFDYIRITPHRPNGQLAGYRLMPGKDPALFTQLGLQANDLAIEINGIPLNDMQQAMSVINELREAKEAAIKIERDGEIRDILVNLSQ
ncbi:type II secretion system protein GspC [Rheinheimera sp. YQF-2]|uniref:Type II secretion system protein GspC n=1 Tax=Rheinheimera lutimaris TaxID=2740584 RepID=A0A7Y5ATB7_9GAMM|nr:type II secretion system protein GspC [Rheinheimera lutimaris]NRQ44187.1 type II secretion system protein GspC [Rheinheimera lutimaris]